MTDGALWFLMYKIDSDYNIAWFSTKTKLEEARTKIKKRCEEWGRRYTDIKCGCIPYNSYLLD